MVVKYFIVFEKDNTRYLVCAKDSTQLEQLLIEDDFELDHYYQFESETFDVPGFIMTEAG